MENPEGLKLSVMVGMLLITTKDLIMDFTRVRFRKGINLILSFYHISGIKRGKASVCSDFGRAVRRELTTRFTDVDLEIVFLSKLCFHFHCSGNIFVVVGSYHGNIVCLRCNSKPILEEAIPDYHPMKL